MAKTPRILHSITVTQFGKHDYTAIILNSNGSEEYLASDHMNDLGRQIWRIVSGIDGGASKDPVDWDLL